MNLAAAISRNSVTRTAAAVLVLALAGSACFAYRLELTRKQSPPGEVLYLSSPRTVKYLSLGYTGLAACIYWTRAVQYFGEKSIAKSKRFDLLRPLLDLTVSLDPHLIPAYEFGAIFLAQAPPYGAGMPDSAVDFVQRGIHENPRDWRLYYHLGFIQYIERQDYRSAGAAFTQAANIAGNPPWMQALPALMSERAGDIQTARILWTKLYETADDEAMRKNAFIRLVALRVDDDITHLEAIQQDYKKRTGKYPATFADLIKLKLLEGVPVDPSGSPYRLESGGKVVVEDARRFPFIRKGIPQGQQPAQTLTKESEKLLKGH